MYSKYKIYEVDFSILIDEAWLTIIQNSSDKNAPLLFGCFLNWKGNYARQYSNRKKINFTDKRCIGLTGSPAELDVKSMFKTCIQV